MRGIHRAFTSVALLAALIAPASRASAQHEAVLGSKGELYVARAGAYGQLFPNGPHKVDPSFPVLALDITRADGAQERVLVEGTEGSEVEQVPFLHFEESSETLFLVWESRLNLIHPRLILTGYKGTWLESFEVISNPFSPKTSPQLAVTHDEYEAGSADLSLQVHRTILHLVWGEENGAGVTETFYAPVFFENGQFTGQSPVFKLNDLALTEATGGSRVPHVAEVRRGRDERTVVVGFSSASGETFTTLEIDALPTQLSKLADEARAHIIDLGARLFPQQTALIASSTRERIISSGGSFHPELVQTLASQAEKFILDNANPRSDLKGIADGARAHIIDLGSKFSGRGLKEATSASTAQGTNITPPQLTTAAEVASSPLQWFRMRILSSREAPEAQAGTLRAFLSERGQSVILAWLQAERVLFRESSDAGWSDLHEIRLDESMDIRRATEVLEKRVRHR